MRDYSKVSGSFWTGKTGKSIRRDMETQIVAMYLMTSPHANMIGVFNLPVGYIQIDTGLTFEGATKGLQRLSEEGFCTYDDDSETVFVHEMAKYQIGESLKATDNRVKDIQKQYDNLPETRIKSAFLEKYQQAFYLNYQPDLISPLEAPPKPEAGTGTEAGTEKSKPIVRKTATRFDEFWTAWPRSARKVGKAVCEKKWKAKALDAIADQIIQHVNEIKITRQWLDGFEPAPMTYLNQGRWTDEIIKDEVKGVSNSKPWFLSASAIEAKAVELGIVKIKDEQFVNFRERVYLKAGITPDDYRKAKQDFDGKK